MHTVMSFFGVVAGLGYLVHQIGNAALHELADAAKAAGLLAGRPQGSAEDERITDIDDPREAAAAMLVAVAGQDAAISDTREHALRAILVRHFGTSAEKTEEILIRGRWHARAATDLASFLRHVAPAIERYCDEDQRLELIDMLEAAAGVHGAIAAATAHAIEALRDRLGV
jgi:uncharacterized tellurite resistance protein B-like protein